MISVSRPEMLVGIVYVQRNRDGVKG